MFETHAALIFQGTDTVDKNKTMMVRYSDSRNMHWLFRTKVLTSMTTPQVFGHMVKMLDLPESHLQLANVIEAIQANKWYASALIVKVPSLGNFMNSIKPGAECQYTIVDQHDIGTLPHSKTLVEELDYELICEARKR